MKPTVFAHPTSSLSKQPTFNLQPSIFTLQPSTFNLQTNLLNPSKINCQQNRFHLFP
ncbi:MAG: hypothetical protein F6K26_34740 [Moorea sp. SIO2I5]|nr:hypothetical protein [Moorena sp. SIO2I5]